MLEQPLEKMSKLDSENIWGQLPRRARELYTWLRWQSQESGSCEILRQNILDSLGWSLDTLRDARRRLERAGALYIYRPGGAVPAVYYPLLHDSIAAPGKEPPTIPPTTPYRRATKSPDSGQKATADEWTERLFKPPTP